MRPPATPPELSHDELVRYSRHLLLPEIGLDGQQRLRAARVLVVGAGGLGSPVALYLAAAGVGTIGLADFDAVDLSNLQRQILHGTGAVGHSKLDSARARLADLNPGVRVVGHEARLTSANAMAILGDYDVVVDGSDNFPTRYLLNDACVLLGLPYVYGSIFRFEGQASVFDARRGPCYRCLFPEPPPPGLVPTCAEGGVLGVLPGIIGSVQALEALKLVLGIGDGLVGRLLLFDALRLTFRELALRKDPLCAACGPSATIHELIDYEAFCGLGENAGFELTAADLRLALDAGSPLQLLDVREPVETAVSGIAGARLIPLGELAGRLTELDRRTPIVAFCARGARSARAVELLRGAGFSDARSLAGGMDAWLASGK